MHVARSLLAVAVLATGFVWSTPSAGACTCPAGTDQTAVDEADVVFEGTVTDRTQLDESLAVLTLAVDGVYKGDARQTQAIYTHARSSACGLFAEVGDGYFVFADVIDGTETEPGYPIGDLRVDQCDGSRPAIPELDLDPAVEPVAPIADASTTTTTLLRPTTATQDLAEPVTGGSVLVIGFIAVGVVGAFIASRIARKNRET